MNKRYGVVVLVILTLAFFGDRYAIRKARHLPVVPPANFSVAIGYCAKLWSWHKLYEKFYNTQVCEWMSTSYE